MTDLPQSTVPTIVAELVEVGKKAAGYLLDNRIWDEVPA